MALLDDTLLRSGPGNLEIINPVGKRRITHVIHDIDGTHSLIRDWPPVMSLSIHWAMTCGLDDDFDSPAALKALTERVAAQPLEETDKFCIESAGLSALTQMEYGIRRAIELGNLPPDPGFVLNERQKRNNSAIIKRIWNGQERFDDMDEPPEMLSFIRERSSRLFKLYEAVLNRASRDKNIAAARKDPQSWRVPGSMEFMSHLHRIGCLNYFVTGAVIYEDGGMLEEVLALGFEIGPGKMVAAIHGSSWDRKLPKDEVIRQLCRQLDIEPANVMTIGDGRTEIKAGVDMGCVTISRLPPAAVRQRQLHEGFGTNYIVPDFTDPLLKTLIRKG